MALFLELRAELDHFADDADGELPNLAVRKKHRLVGRIVRDEQDALGPFFQPFDGRLVPVHQSDDNISRVGIVLLANDDDRPPWENFGSMLSPRTCKAKNSPADARASSISS